MKHLAVIGFLALGLSSCNLSEAERMDLSRSEVSGVACANPEVRFAGSDSIPLTVLLQASYNQGLAKHFELVWKDLGTVTDWTGYVQARQGDQTLFTFVFETPTSNERVTETPWQNSNWADALDSITFTLSPNLCRESRTPLNLHVYDDRPSLSIRIRNDLTSLRNGDTLRAELRNQSASDAIQVASNYSGLRLVGEYLVTVKPGENKAMEWIVLAASGQRGWLDLSWGSHGQSRRFEFQTR